MREKSADFLRKSCRFFLPTFFADFFCQLFLRIFWEKVAKFCCRDLLRGKVAIFLAGDYRFFLMTFMEVLSILDFLAFAVLIVFIVFWRVVSFLGTCIFLMLMVISIIVPHSLLRSTDIWFTYDFFDCVIWKLFWCWIRCSYNVLFV